jgi:hypothetical protein
MEDCAPRGDLGWSGDLDRDFNGVVARSRPGSFRFWEQGSRLHCSSAKTAPDILEGQPSEKDPARRC